MAEQEKLRECPNPACNGTDIVETSVIEDDGNILRAKKCSDCGLTGPLGNYANCGCLWNALPRTQAGAVGVVEGRLHDAVMRRQKYQGKTSGQRKAYQAMIEVRCLQELLQDLLATLQEKNDG